MGRSRNLDGFPRSAGATGRVVVGCALLAWLAIAPGALAAAPFEAHGSVEQVYATGLRPGARMTLFDRRGSEVATKAADSLGGVLFRNVAPGGGYRVASPRRGPKSGPLQVLTTGSAPPSTDIYNQSIPSSGYGYLTTRDGTKLAIDVHPAAGRDPRRARRSNCRRCRPARRRP